MPGATKPNNKLQSTLLITKCWDSLTDTDLALFVVDSVKRMDFEVRKSAQWLKEFKVDHDEKRLKDAMKDESFKPENLA